MSYPFAPCEEKCVVKPISLQNPKLPCTMTVKNQWPLDEWAGKFVDKPRVSVEGVYYPADPCTAMCDRHTNRQVVGVLGKPAHNYKLLGGLLTNVQFYKNCAV